MPTKAELELHRDQYHDLLNQARAAELTGELSKAVELAICSWQFVDGMMQFERRFEDSEFKSVEGIDIVLRLAPPLLDIECLDKLAILLKSQRRIDKNTSDNLAERLEKARTRTWNIHRLWSLLEENPAETATKLSCLSGIGYDECVRLLTDGVRTQIFNVHSGLGEERFSIAASMDNPVLAKCSSCGVIAKAAKYRFLEPQTCPKCRNSGYFVIFVGASH